MMLSIIFQAYNLLPYLSALDNVITAMEISNTPQKEYRQVALDRLARVGINETLQNNKSLNYLGTTTTRSDRPSDLLRTSVDHCG